MTPLSITPDIDAAPWTELMAGLDPELNPARTEDAAQLTHIGLLRHGTSEGRAVAAMVVRLPDGRDVIVQTTWRLLQGAVRAMAAGPVGSEEVLD